MRSKTKAKTKKRTTGKTSRTAHAGTGKSPADQYFGRLKVESFSKLTGGNSAVYALAQQR